MDVSRITPAVLTEDRLDASYYGTRYLHNEAFLKKCGVPMVPVGTLTDKCNCGATPKEVVYDGKGTGLVRTTDVRPNVFLAEGVLRTSELRVSPDASVAAVPGDLLYTMSGTIGYAAVIHDGVDVVSFSNTIARARFGARTGQDARFTAAFFNCKYGYTQSLRLVSGGIQGHVMPNPFKRLPVPTPAPDAQLYIGDKVRQAERLRERARRLRRDLDCLLSIPSLNEALRTVEQRTNRVSASDLNPRLDSKYYGSRAMAVLHAAGANSVAVGALVEEVSNGFEHRDFDAEGTPYITVTEVSGGRLVLATAPRLGAGVSIPEKARIDTRCTLVVRTGSIGVAVPVFEEDTHAAISSHLIRLRFKSEEEAAIVAAFLNSEAGRVLQRKISYGAVQPQIGQEELLALPIPKSLLDSGESILSTLRTEDAALRAAQRLTVSATTLVEHLIDGRLAEADLVAAQKALEAGDRSVDRELMKGLRQSDAPDVKPPIADVDALYTLLDGSEGQDA
jgi:type I restriction enzyme S subunit